MCSTGYHFRDLIRLKSLIPCDLNQLFIINYSLYQYPFNLIVDLFYLCLIPGSKSEQ